MNTPDPQLLAYQAKRVHAETGLTPRDLQERCDLLMTELRDAANELRRHCSGFRQLRILEELEPAEQEVA